MGADQHSDWNAITASALDWWRDAGVDEWVGDEPRDWYAAPRRQAAPIHPQPSASAMPEALTPFEAWRLSDAAPEAGWNGHRFAAAGPDAAALMVLVDCPDRDDDPAIGLLSGRCARLFGAMLAAIGSSRDAIYLASVCVARPPAGQIAPEQTQRLADIALHRVAIAQPKFVLALGNAASRAVLGMDVLAARGTLRTINHGAGDTRVVASFHPRFLLDRPERKADAWRDLQLILGGMS